MCLHLLEMLGADVQCELNRKSCFLAEKRLTSLTIMLNDAPAASPDSQEISPQEKALRWLQQRVGETGATNLQIAQVCGCSPKHVSLVLRGYDPISEGFGGKLLNMDALYRSDEDRRAFADLLREAWLDRKLNGVDERRSAHRPNPQRGFDEVWLAGQPQQERAGLYLKALRERAKSEHHEGMTQPLLSAYLGLEIGVREMEKGDVPIDRAYWTPLLDHPHLRKTVDERQRFSQLLQESAQAWGQMRTESAQLGVTLDPHASRGLLTSGASERGL